MSITLGNACSEPRCCCPPETPVIVAIEKYVEENGSGMYVSVSVETRADLEALLADGAILIGVTDNGERHYINGDILL